MATVAICCFTNAAGSWLTGVYENGVNINGWKFHTNAPSSRYFMRDAGKLKWSEIWATTAEKAKTYRWNAASSYLDNVPNSTKPESDSLEYDNTEVESIWDDMTWVGTKPSTEPHFNTYLYKHYTVVIDGTLKVYSKDSQIRHTDGTLKVYSKGEHIRLGTGTLKVYKKTSHIRGPFVTGTLKVYSKDTMIREGDGKLKVYSKDTQIRTKTSYLKVYSKDDYIRGGTNPLDSILHWLGAVVARRKKKKRRK